MIKKQMYESPEVALLEVVLKRSLMILSNGANYGENGGAGGNDEYEDGESF